MSDWIKVRLGDLGNFSTSSVDKKLVEGEKVVNLVNYMDVYKSNTINSSIDFMQVSASSVEAARSQVLIGDILFTPSSETPDDIGHSAVVAENLRNTLHSYHTVRLRPHDENTLDIRFSAWFCNAAEVRKEFEKKCAGSTRYTLSIPAFRSVEIKIPKSKNIQKKIAEYLDTIDIAIEKTEALIEKYQQIKAGLMHDLFTRGIGTDGQLRPPREQAPALYQHTPIGWIPKEWVVKFCQDVFTIDSGITLGAHRRPKNNARPYLRVANVFKERIALDDVSYLEASDEENSRYGLKTYDLLLVEGHANIQQIGRCGMIENNAEGMLFQNHLFRLRAVEVSPHFGMYLLNSHIARKYWEKTCSTSSGLNTINRTMLGKMSFGIPSSNEQVIVVKMLRSISGQIEAEKNYLTKILDQKSGLMHDLLTGKVRVKLDSKTSEMAGG